jgi:hypothetical protein
VLQALISTLVGTLHLTLGVDVSSCFSPTWGAPLWCPSGGPLVVPACSLSVSSCVGPLVVFMARKDEPARRGHTLVGGRFAAVPSRGGKALGFKVDEVGISQPPTPAATGSRDGPARFRALRSWMCWLRRGVRAGCCPRGAAAPLGAGHVHCGARAVAWACR